MSLRMGELFAGYGGLGMGVANVLDTELAWYSEIDKGALKVLGHRFPDVPNLGDITTIDWSHVEPVDVLTGGFPCQDVSAAGKRAGIRPGTRSGLWSQFAYAIDQLRPRMVVIENVRGLLSADAHSDVEPCPWCVGDEPDGALRALGAVLGDLADLGFDADWIGLPASSVGAPHGRWREFVVAYPDDTRRVEQRRPQPTRAEHATAEHRGSLLPTPRATDGTKGGPNQRGSSGDLMLPSAVTLLPTPVTTDSSDAARHTTTTGVAHSGTSLTDALRLLPTPAVNDMGASYTPDEWDAWTDRMKAEHGNGNGHGKSLHIEAARLLPTPEAKNSHAGQDYARASRAGSGGDDLVTAVIKSHVDQWGQYAAAIHRWEQLTRPTPAPTETGPKGNPRLSARFSEWMMGLPAGWVTDVPGITRNEALKALGNGVVPQQAAAALRFLLAQEVAA